MNLTFRLPANFSLQRQLTIITQAENRKGVLHASIIEDGFNKTLEIEIGRMSYQDVLDLGAFLAENTIVY